MDQAMNRWKKPRGNPWHMRYFWVLVWGLVLIILLIMLEPSS